MKMLLCFPTFLLNAWVKTCASSFGIYFFYVCLFFMLMATKIPPKNKAKTKINHKYRWIWDDLSQFCQIWIFIIGYLKTAEVSLFWLRYMYIYPCICIFTYIYPQVKDTYDLVYIYNLYIYKVAACT